MTKENQTYSKIDNELILDILSRLREAENKLTLLEHKVDEQIRASKEIRENGMRIFWIVVSAVITVIVTITIGNFIDG